MAGVGVGGSSSMHPRTMAGAIALGFLGAIGAYVVLVLLVILASPS